jgi:hypothetical protein
MKHRLILDDGTDLGIIYLFGPMPYVGFTFTFDGKGFKVLSIQGAAFTKIPDTEIDIIIIATEVPRIY